MIYEELLRVADRSDHEIHKACLVGSRVYGTYTEDSDYDYVLILKEESAKNQLIRQAKINVTVQSLGHFRDAISSGNVFAYEVFFCPKEHVLKDSGLTIPQIRGPERTRIIESAVEKATNDFQKASRILNPKRVYHAFRVLNFAQQLVDFGVIRDFTQAQIIYEIVMTDPGLFKFDSLASFEARVRELTSRLGP